MFKINVEKTSKLKKKCSHKLGIHEFYDCQVKTGKFCRRRNGMEWSNGGVQYDSKVLINTLFLG